MKDFLENLLKGIEIVSVYLAGAIKYIEYFVMYAPVVVKWVMQQMDMLQPLIDKGSLNPDDAREKIVTAGLDRFHGSGPVVTAGMLRALIENLHMIRKAVRIGKDPYIDKEALAVSKGYIKSDDLDLARKAMPNFQPLD